MALKEYKMFIDGEWIGSSSKELSDVINPATEAIIARVPKATRQDTRSAIAAARSAFEKGVWSEKTPSERSVVLWRLSDLLEKNLLSFAKLESLNVGKTIKYSRDSDLPFIIDNLRFFAGAARMLEGKAAAEYSGIGTSFIRREPIGVVGAIVPWNYPLYIAVWKLAPALAAGNAVVIKPASYTPLTLLEFAALAQKAGIPKGILNVVTGEGSVVGKELASNGNVDMLALTGDTSTGKRVAQLGATTLKRMHLELGGKAPFIVLRDADIDAATEGAIVSSFWNTGQDCTSTTRVFVHNSMYQKFVSLLIKKAKKIRVGNPLSEKIDMGPLISKKQRDRVEEYVKSGIAQGAKIECGGNRPAALKKGYFYSPTIFSDVTMDMKIAREEIFGPVLCVLRYSTTDDAIKQANSVPYGLAASVWGSNAAELFKVVRALKAGTVWVNEHGVLVSEMPHGGYKQSGFGKDLSLYSLEEYTQLKHVYIDQTGAVRKSWYYTVYGDK